MITNVQYSIDDGSQVRITFDDFSTVLQPYENGVRYKYTDEIDEWLGLGNTIEPYDEYYGMDIAQIRAVNQDMVDKDCKLHILSYWSGPAQSNVSMGLYDQTTCELCKSEISATLIENKEFIDAIESLTTAAEIDAYMSTITRGTLTGRIS